MGSNIDTEELTNCLKVITWNRRFLQLFGIWPLKVYDPLFLSSFIYLFLHTTLVIMYGLNNYRGNGDLVMTNVSETVIITGVLIKITIFRLKKDSLAEFLREIEDDFKEKNYRNRKEMLSFLSYNRQAFLFIVVALPCMGSATIFYFFQSLSANIKMVITNSSLGYRLPYNTRPIVKIDDVTTYVFSCIYQSLVVPFYIFGVGGCNSFFVTLSLHVSGQLSVLNHRVKDALNKPDSYRYEITQLVVRHKQLIRLADTLEEDFNIAILQQLLQTMWSLCYVGFLALMDTSQNVHLFVCVAFGITVMSTLFVYCYTGECLIQESTKFGEAFYDSEWYNISQTDLKLVFICMLRSSKPLKLTSGKFVVLSLTTYTDIIKASMGYFSLMRTLL